jgi:hypothetical protein
MKAKSAVTTALLLFVAASIGVLTVKSLRQRPAAAPAGEHAATAAAAANALEPAPTLADGVVVYGFHGTVRCPTCREIEAGAHQALESGFAEQLKDGQIVWRVVNYEQPGNEHFATDYKLIAPTVVLVRMVRGQQQQWKNLDRVWELVGDDAAFIKYIQEETETMLNGGENPSPVAEAGSPSQRS